MGGYEAGNIETQKTETDRKRDGRRSSKKTRMSLTFRIGGKRWGKERENRHKSSVLGGARTKKKKRKKKKSAETLEFSP